MFRKYLCIENTSRACNKLYVSAFSLAIISFMYSLDYDRRLENRPGLVMTISIVGPCAYLNGMGGGEILFIDIAGGSADIASAHSSIGGLVVQCFRFYWYGKFSAQHIKPSEDPQVIMTDIVPTTYELCAI